MSNIRMIEAREKREALNDVPQEERDSEWRDRVVLANQIVQSLLIEQIGAASTSTPGWGTPTKKMERVNYSITPGWGN